MSERVTLAAPTPLPPGWHEEREIGALMDQWQAKPRPALVTVADLAAAKSCRCPRCGDPCAGVMVVDRGRGWQPWRLAVCPGCGVYGDLQSLR